MTPGRFEGKQSSRLHRSAEGPRPAEGAVVRTYRRYAPIYDGLFGAVLQPGRRALAEAASRVANGAPMSLLEIGVGTGLTLPLYSPCIEVTGVDISAEMLAKARVRAAAMPDRKISLRIMDGERLLFEDGSFDCVALPYVLSVTPHAPRLVSEVRRVCRPGGTVLVLNHFSGSRFWWMFERLVQPLADRIGFRSDFGFEEQVARHDWDVREVREVNLLGLSRLATIRNS